MPEPLHPPYGITQPRQLIRWEDVNSQNGKLSRTRLCATFPAIQFVIETESGKGIVISAIYKFRSTNNFSFILNNLKTLVWPDDTLVCVAYKDTDGTVYRYALNSYFKVTFSSSILEFIPYKGQMIKKNFRIEYWTMPSITAVLAYLIDDNGARILDDNGNEIVVLN